MVLVQLELVRATLRRSFTFDAVESRDDLPSTINRDKSTNSFQSLLETPELGLLPES